MGKQRNKRRKGINNHNPDAVVEKKIKIKE
jgi:hypothetical protein